MGLAAWYLRIDRSRMSKGSQIALRLLGLLLLVLAAIACSVIPINIPQNEGGGGARDGGLAADLAAQGDAKWSNGDAGVTPPYGDASIGFADAAASDAGVGDALADGLGDGLMDGMGDGLVGDGPGPDAVLEAGVDESGAGDLGPAMDAEVADDSLPGD
jgi:hypothetical protein